MLDGAFYKSSDGPNAHRVVQRCVRSTAIGHRLGPAHIHPRACGSEPNRVRATNDRATDSYGASRGYRHIDTGPTD